MLLTPGEPERPAPPDARSHKGGIPIITAPDGTSQLHSRFNTRLPDVSIHGNGAATASAAAAAGGRYMAGPIFVARSCSGILSKCPSPVRLPRHARRSRLL